MRRFETVMIIGAALMLGACAGNANAAPFAATVGQNGTVATPGISVSGTGEITGTPDTLSVNLGVSVRGETVEEATTEAASAATALIDSLVANGVEREDITTTNYSIHPEYDYRNDSQRLLGYRVTNTVRAKITNIGESGSVIDDATSAAGDAVTVNGISFSIEDDAGMVEAAREAAWNDAKAKAEQLASLSGQSLGAVISISETVSRPPVPIDFARLEAADAAATPIEPGTASVSISLQVEFAFSG